MQNISVEEILLLVTGRQICLQESLSALEQSAKEM